MAYYYVDKKAQPNGDHLVHTTGCESMPDGEDRTSLGDLADCDLGMMAARRYFAQVNGCALCCPACHRR